MRSLTSAVLNAFVNPVTGHRVVPGTVLGYRRDGRPIYVVAGGSGEGSGDGGEGAGDTDDDSAAGDDQDDSDASSGKDPKISGAFDADRAKRSITAAREAEKKAKADKKAADDRLAGVLKALGVTADGKADPEEQAKQLTNRAEAAEARANALATRDAVRTAAGKHQADAEALLDSQKFLSGLKDLDPSADDYADKVGDLVKAAVKASPTKYGTATAQGAGKRGADHSGGNGGTGRPANLREAFARKHQ